MGRRAGIAAPARVRSAEPGRRAAAERERNGDAARAMNALRRFVRVLRSTSVTVERSIGLTAAQLFALRAIAACPGQSLGELATRTLTTQSSVSEVISRLVARGLVTRHPSVMDRRRMELGVTEAGRRMLDRAPDSVQQRLVTGFERLPAPSRRALADAMEAWIAASGLEVVPATMFFEPLDPPDGEA